MIGIMLVGAWFLIHQHCCLADAGPSPRNIMVDPLMRRSPLEKNFIRFGRSWPPRDGLTANHLMSPAINDEPTKDWGTINHREARGKENFIRFGRSMSMNQLQSPSENEAVWESLVVRHPLIHEGPLMSEDDESFLNKMNNKYSDNYLPETIGPRAARSKQNFIRFGRSNSVLSKNKKYSGLTKDNFIRFGRDQIEESKNDIIADRDHADTFDQLNMFRDTRDKTKSKGGKSSGFIRFGKSIESTVYNTDGIREKRYAAPPTYGTHCKDELGHCDHCIGAKTLNLDPTMIVAPEFSLLPKIPFQKTPLKKNFIRLG